MGATADSDDEIFYPTVEPNNLEPAVKEVQGNSSSEKEKEKEQQEQEKREGTNPIKTQKKTPMPRWPLRKAKPGGSLTEQTRLPTPKFKTEMRTQAFGIFERQEHSQNKYENWSRTPQKNDPFPGDIKPFKFAQIRK